MWRKEQDKYVERGKGLTVSINYKNDFKLVSSHFGDVTVCFASGGGLAKLLLSARFRPCGAQNAVLTDQ
jgi:hypothetical protein